MPSDGVRVSFHVDDARRQTCNELTQIGACHFRPYKLELATLGLTKFFGLPHMEYSYAVPEDSSECVRLRSKTRQNAISEEGLLSIGITAETWARNVKAEMLVGRICRHDGRMVGYCFGSRLHGEIVVLALLPEFEASGIGKALLSQVVQHLTAFGHKRLFLSCSPDPGSRSYGFYRHMGWQSTGNFEKNGDEILELKNHLPGSEAGEA